MLAEIFSAILGRAKRGDPEAALIVLRVAEKQRQSLLPTHNSLLDTEAFLSELQSTR